MINLSELQAVRGSLDKQRNLRSNRGEESYQEGLRLLERYNQAPSQERLLQAMHKFLECMTQQRDRVEPLVILSYIYHALKSPQMAIKYYRLAAALNAEALPVKNLQAILTQQPRISTVAEHRQAPSAMPASTPLAPAEMDYDTLYTETETLIRSDLRRLIKIPFTHQPILDEATLQAQTDELLVSEHRLEGLKRQLSVLDAELDVTGLERLLNPVEKRLAQIRRLHLLSVDAMDILAETERLSQRTLTESLRVPPSPAELETILDRCDWIADRLDALEQQGLAIDQLVQSYKKLILVIEKLQDIHEEFDS